MGLKSTNDKYLAKYDKWLAIKSKQATPYPVFLEVTNKPIDGDKKAAAGITKYTRPTEYAIEFSKPYFNKVKTNEPKTKKIIAHELAHIKTYKKEHNGHGPKFQKEAIRLGAAEYSTSHGTLTPEELKRAKKGEFVRHVKKK